MMRLERVMDIREIIAKKRDGLELTSSEIARFVSGYVDDNISDAQMAALLMAIMLRGMSIREIGDLTLAMADSGAHPDLSGVRGTTVDKHSTGGVGDKTTLVVAPLVAALGVPVPKISGRSLAHTGGTLDKLESVPGLTTALSPARFSRQVAEIGVAIAAQTEEIVPADKKLYALRDKTATVESLALGVSSIMSKKLAVGADAIVLDVKVGDARVGTAMEEARLFAETMVAIGARCGRRMVALLTRMDEPIGRSVGDALELCEAVDALAGKGPADLNILCEIVSGHMLALGGVAPDAAHGAQLARRVLAEGSGLAKLRELVQWQGGDPAVVDGPEVLLEGCVRVPVLASENGYVTGIDARRIGAALRNLKAEAGARRAVCGTLIHRKVAHSVSAGEAVATIVSPEGLNDEVTQFAAEVTASFTIAEQPVSVPDVLLDAIEG